jgi:hypothetical protein
VIRVTELRTMKIDAAERPTMLARIGMRLTRDE